MSASDPAHDLQGALGYRFARGALLEQLLRDRSAECVAACGFAAGRSSQHLGPLQIGNQSVQHELCPLWIFLNSPPVANADHSTRFAVP